MERANHVTGDICVMCSCIYHIAITLIDLLDYIHLIIINHQEGSQ